MVLGLGSTSGTETPPVNPINPPLPQSSSPPPPMLTGASFYIVPQGPTPSLNFPTPSFRWNNNQQYFNFFPTYPGLNPVQPWVQPPNRTEPLNFPILRYGSGSGSGPSPAENLRTNPGLRFGSSPNPSENHSSENLRTNFGLRIGSETNRDENRNNPPIPRFGLETNRAEDLSIPILRYGSGSSSGSSFPDNLRTNPAQIFRFDSPSNRNEPTFRFGSPSNRNETRSNPVFEFGSSANPDERRSNPAFEFGSSANQDERRNNPIFGFGSSSNRPEELGSLFRRISVTMNNREENRSNQVVPRFSASPNRDENIGFAPGLNRVENNEENNRARAIDMLLEAARPVDQEDDGVEEAVEMEHREKAKNSDETSGESDGDSDGDSDDGSDDESDDESVDESEGDGDVDDGDGDAAGAVDEEGAKEEEAKEEGEVEEPVVKKWNLRPRKPAAKSPIVGSTSRVRARTGKPRPQGLRAVPPRASMEDKKPRISLTLTKEEIEADFLKMTGEKPSKKPAKRTKSQQKKIDMCFPGVLLNTVTQEMYHVRDPPLKP